MKDELREIVMQVTKTVPLKKGKIVIDIGCNDATLIKFYDKFVIKVGFDPVSKFGKYFTQKK